MNRIIAFVVFLCLGGALRAANLVAAASNNFTTAATWGVAEAGASAAQTTKSSSTNTTTSYVYSSAFTCTNTDVIDGLLLHAKQVTTTGTVSVALSDDNGVTATRSVTINASDLPVDQTWVFFKFGSTLTCDGGADYKVGVLGSSAGNATFYRDGTAGNWARLLRTTATQTPVAADNLYIAGEWTAAGTVNALTVTMNETATTAYGTMDVGLSGTVSYGTTASTNYYLRLSGSLNIWSGGTFSMGTSGTPMPSTSTGKLNLNCGSNVQYGVIVNNGGTFNAYGATKTTSAFLAADASAGATTLTSNVSTGWLSGDEIGIASTTRTGSETEKKTMSGNATGTSIPIAALTNAHSGTSPVRAELVNLTRNVQVFGASASLQTYFLASATSTTNLSYAEFYWMGSGNTNQRGVDIQITTTNFTASNSSFHDFTVANSIIFNVGNMTSGVMTLSGNVTYYSENYTFNNTATANTTWVVTNNIFLRNNSGILVALSDTGGTFTNNTLVGSQGTGLYITEVNVTGDLSGNTVHSGGNGFNNAAGILFPSPPSIDYIFPPNTVWRFNGAGFQMNTGLSTNRFGIRGMVAWGNSSTNIWMTGSSYRQLVFSDLVLNGDTSFSTQYGLNIATQAYSYYLNNCTFGVASGVKTTHSTSDITTNFAIGYGNKVTFGSSVTLTASNNTWGFIGINSWGGTAGDNRYSYYSTVPTFGYTGQTDTAIYKTAAPSQRITPVYSGPKSFSSVKTVALSSGATTTISVWVRKSISTDPSGANYNGSQPRLMVQTNAACGIGNGYDDVTLATASAAVGTWELLSGTTSAVSADCVLNAYVDLDGTTGWVNVDDWTVTNPQATGAEKYWNYGGTQLTIPGAGGTSATLAFPIVQ